MRLLKCFTVFAVIISLNSCQNSSGDVKSLETEIDSVSYALGMDMAYKIKQNFKYADYNLFLQGFKNAADSTNLLIENKDISVFITRYFQKQLEKRQEAIAEKNFAEFKVANEKFLEENKKKEGVITTKSGLQYKVIKEGTGKKPKPTSKIKINYHGTNINGDVFDSTVERGTPYVSKANVFVKGFNEGLLLMNEGAKYKFFIPYDLGYGIRQRSAIIKPYTTLVFEVELLEIQEE
ncbi:MAG: FKBP-type peptidyl-prolyl cis-trans isomerase [Flavobacteriaceae bacterium]|nr:FKBP-type peptidyl-prolyl cis-trans isomerase [Flavobacteriaceae bacterium]